LTICIIQFSVFRKQVYYNSRILISGCVKPFIVMPFLFFMMPTIDSVNFDACCLYGIAINSKPAIHQLEIK